MILDDVIDIVSNQILHQLMVDNVLASRKEYLRMVEFAQNQYMNVKDRFIAEPWYSNNHVSIGEKDKQQLIKLIHKIVQQNMRGAK